MVVSAGAYSGLDMVLRSGDCAVRDYGAESHSTNDRQMKNEEREMRNAKMDKGKER